jgi:hypothetical protein
MHLKELAPMADEIAISKAQLTAWADSLIHMNHHGTLVQREISAGNLERASHLAERARKRAWLMLNELFEYGAEKPEGYCEPDSHA